MKEMIVYKLDLYLLILDKRMIVNMNGKIMGLIKLDVMHGV